LTFAIPFPAPFYTRPRITGSTYTSCSRRCSLGTRRSGSRTYRHDMRNFGMRSRMVTHHGASTNTRATKRRSSWLQMREKAGSRERLRIMNAWWSGAGRDVKRCGRAGSHKKGRSSNRWISSLSRVNRRRSLSTDLFRFSYDLDLISTFKSPCGFLSTRKRLYEPVHLRVVSSGVTSVTSIDLAQAAPRILDSVVKKRQVKSLLNYHYYLIA